MDAGAGLTHQRHGSVDRTDRLSGGGVGRQREPPEQQRRHCDDREHGQQYQRQRAVYQHQRHQHPDDGGQADERRDHAGLQERGQRVDVRRRPRHDPAGRLTFVVVEAETLQLDESLDPQQIQEFARRYGRDPLRVVVGQPLTEDHDRADAAEHDQRGQRSSGDA